MSGFFLSIVNMSISASWIVFAVLLLRLLLKKAPKWITVLLWGIVAIRLICPFSIESVMSLITSSISLPFIFKLGVEKGRTAYYLMIGMVCGASVLASSFFRSDLQAEIRPNTILIVMSIVGVGVYILSWLLSIRFFKKREIQ